MKINKIISTIGLSSILVSSVHATLHSDKVVLNGNMTLKYTKTPKSVNSFNNMFKDGVFYGRFRTNLFNWDWKTENSKQKDNYALGIGGSFIYKSASFKGFSTTAGLYTSQNPSFYRMNSDEVGYLKAGKDSLSRDDTSKTSKFGMSVLAQAYVQYDIKKSSLYVGRQLFESVFTKSNDTKMIPNSFDGVTATIKTIPNTTIKFAYLIKQKLRDHTSSHDVIAYNPDNKWSENDDSSVNKNLTVARVGNNNKLIIASLTNRSIKNLKLNLSYANVKNILSNAVVEAHYKISLSNWHIIPGFRYMQQFDNLDASYDVANLKGNSTGYSDPKSLDSSLLAVRLDLKNGAFLTRIGYSKVADKADIVAPWRGFPTGGFTRAMGQYNWYANTKTYMLRVGYDFGKANIINGFSLMARYAIQDFDDNKPGVQADSNILHIDARQNIGNNMELKVRVGINSADSSTAKSDPSYNEYRVELNYFF